MLVLCRKLHLFSGKSTKTAATRAALTSICTKSFFSWGFAPDPTGGAYSAPPALAVVREPTSKGRERRDGVRPLP